MMATATIPYVTIRFTWQVSSGCKPNGICMMAALLLGGLAARSGPSACKRVGRAAGEVGVGMVWDDLYP
jgi:hypothetical protein